ncbi:MarR family winged helix-turn-helix transcriptional regulator [Streptomyces shenzhenensis]|uniref:MarR family winged helix-turn-helix transcriptional regulator n=1 Tax=Streptomyces shenzhenensis TaxID=943815 RepID=UPI0036CB8148
MAHAPRDQQAREDLTYALVDRVLALSGATFGAVNRALRELELTEPLANLLWHISPVAAAPTMGELAGKLYCDPSTVTFLISKLEKAGLVARQPGARDKRSREVHLTDAGRAARGRLVELVTEHTPLINLSTAEREQFLALASKALPLENDSEPPECFA